MGCHCLLRVKSLGPVIFALLILARTGCVVSVCFSGCIFSAQQPLVAHSCQIGQWPFGSFLIITSWIILRWVSVFFFFFLLAVLGLLWCSGFSLVAVSRGRSPLPVLGLLIVVVCLAAEHGP